MSIQSVDITKSLSNALQNTGIEIHDYKLNGTSVDYEALAVKISKQRASAVEKEIIPLETKMRKRNNDLKDLGTLLSQFSGYQKNFKSDAAGNTECLIDASAYDGYKKYFGSYPPLSRQSGDKYYIQNAGLAETIQRLKSEIDSLNNAAQLDMNRLQDLVTKRDDSFTNATDIMNTISGTRDTVLGAI